MAQKKGQTGNVNGRPKGSSNKVSTELKQWVSNFIDNNRDQIERDFMSVDPDKRLAMFEKMLQYVLPKQQQQQIVDDKLNEDKKKLYQALGLKCDE